MECFLSQLQSSHFISSQECSRPQKYISGIECSSLSFLPNFYSTYTLMYSFFSKSVTDALIFFPSEVIHKSAIPNLTLYDTWYAVIPHVQFRQLYLTVFEICTFCLLLEYILYLQTTIIWYCNKYSYLFFDFHVPVTQV